MNDVPDRAALHMLSTEQTRPELADLDLMSADRLVEVMCADVHRVPEAIDAARDAIARAIDGVVARLDGGGRLIYVGAGTAGRLGMLDAAESGPTFNVPQGQVIGVLAGGSGALDVPIENAEDDHGGGAQALRALGVSERDAVVGIAASGRTPFVLGAVQAARGAGALTIGLACNRATPLSALVEIPIDVIVGPEVIAGSTRLNAGTAQKIVLNVISTAAMVRLGKTYGGLMVDLRATNAKLRDRAARIVASIAGVSPERAREALAQSDWNAKTAAAMLVGRIDREQAEATLARHRGRLRPALSDLAPGTREHRPGAGDGSRTTAVARRLGVAAAVIDGRLVRGDLSVEGERIVGVGLAGRGTGIAIPGLIDAQVNGYAGVDVLGADEPALQSMGTALRADGVAAYQPTLITAGEDELLAALARVGRVRSGRGDAAAILGVHLEGPFLSPARPGTHPVEHLRPPDRRLLERLLDAGPVRMVTLAPELPGALELIEVCVRRGVIVSLGHSQASAAQAASGFASGATAVTHLFNAMAPVSARTPGLAIASLVTPGIGVQLIADGVHVADELITMAFATAGDRVSLVTDAIAAAPDADGRFWLGAVEVTVAGGVARRADGTLAGGVSRLADGLARLRRLGISTPAAVAAVTARPARLLGAEPWGRLAIGRRADLVLLDDELTVQRVLVGGREAERVATPQGGGS